MNRSILSLAVDAHLSGDDETAMALFYEFITGHEWSAREAAQTGAE